MGLMAQSHREGLQPLSPQTVTMEHQGPSNASTEQHLQQGPLPGTAEDSHQLWTPNAETPLLIICGGEF